MSDKLTDEQINEIGNELQAGRKLAAVKLYKEWTGSSLVEAKNFVESLPDGMDAEYGNPGELGKNIETNQMDRILDALQQGNKVQAARLYREHSGSTLKEAKEFVEGLMKELGIEDRGGCAGMVLLLAILASGITIAVT